MGAAVGQDCALLEEICGWINEKATVPVWAKMTPNITDITQVLIFLRCLFPFYLYMFVISVDFMCGGIKEKGKSVVHFLTKAKCLF